MNMLLVEPNLKHHTLTTVIYVISLVILGAFEKFRKAPISLVMSSSSVRPSACNNSVLTGRIFMKFGI